jgi:hypothetical protein
MKLTASIFAACLLAASGALYAQGSPAPADKGQRTERHDQRHERHGQREKMKAAHQKARQACDAKQGQEHRDCMRKEMCAQSKAPGRCEEHFKERSEAFNKAYDACKGKATGDEFRTCMRAQRVSAKK